MAVILQGNIEYSLDSSKLYYYRSLLWSESFPIENNSILLNSTNFSHDSPITSTSISTLSPSSEGMVSALFGSSSGGQEEERSCSGQNLLEALWRLLEIR